MTFDMSTSRWRPWSAAALVGVARADITPPVGIRAHNWGASTRETCTGLHRPLTLTAMAFAQSRAEMAYLVSMDLGWWASALDEGELRARVRADLGVPEERLLLHLVHTHAGPSIRSDEHALPGGELIPEYLAELGATISSACARARRDAVPASITWSYGRCELAVVRDLPCGSRDIVAFNPDLPADDTMLVGRVTSDEGAPVATLLNYACHPTTLAWDNSLLSPDYVGAARFLVESETGAPCLFVQGASGDLSPREGYTGDVEVADRNGRVLGHAALATLANMPPPRTALRLADVVESGAAIGVWRAEETVPTGGVQCSMRVLDLPAKPDQAPAGGVSVSPRAAEERRRRAARIRAGYVQGGVARHPCWLWRLGDALLVAHPGEAYSALQVQLRTRHQDRPIIVANLTNGPGHVYLPDRPAYERDRYQVWQTAVAAGGLEAMTDAVDQDIREIVEGASS